jgi:DNA modification methylase
MNTILEGDALAMLKTLPDESVQCCVTSPPYYGLRDYGIGGQIGLEATPADYIAKLVEVFREVRRVMRNDGTCWLNLGDSYANDQQWGGHSSGKHRKELHAIRRPRRFTGLPGKNLLMIPARVAIALQEDGWILRQDCIWHKPTAMPESVTDRPTTAHEHVFLLAKSERYFYDAEAIKEPSVSGHSSGNGFKRDARLSYLDEYGKARGNDQEWVSCEVRNKRSVWTVASQPYPEAHFATMPPKLVEPCILAGTSPRACEHCAAPWKRITVSTGHVNTREQARVPNNNPTKTDSTGWKPQRAGTDEWEPTCSCDNAGSGRCVILDPFMGAGTVALVALQYNRRYLGIELNPKYIELAKKRIAVIQPELWSA